MLTHFPYFLLFSGFNIIANICKSSRGYDLLVHDDFSFTKESYSQRLGHTIWRCSRHNSKDCYGRAVTKVINGTPLMKLTHPHNHERNDEGKNHK